MWAPWAFVISSSLRIVNHWKVKNKTCSSTYFLSLFSYYSEDKDSSYSSPSCCSGHRWDESYLVRSCSQFCGSLTKSEPPHEHPKALLFIRGVSQLGQHSASLSTLHALLYHLRRGTIRRPGETRKSQVAQDDSDSGLRLNQPDTAWIALLDSCKIRTVFYRKLKEKVLQFALWPSFASNGYS